MTINTGINIANTFLLLTSCAICYALYRITSSMRKSNIKLVIKHISVLILSGLFVIAGGIAALAKSDGNKIYEAIIIVIFSLFLLYVIYLILKDIIGLIVSPEKQMAEIDSKMKTTEKFISNQSQNDLSVIKVIRQMPSLVVPYILFIILT